MDTETDILEKLTKYALDLLARRSYSEQEIRTKLSRYSYRKQIPDSTLYIDEVVAFLYDKQFLNDRDFAEAYIRDRIALKHRSRRMLTQELKGKGISSTLIQELMQDYDELPHAQALIDKKPYTDPQKAKAYLARQGFSWDVINEVI